MLPTGGSGFYQGTLQVSSSGVYDGSLWVRQNGTWFSPLPVADGGRNHVRFAVGVAAAPRLVSVSPAVGIPGQEVRVKVQGANLHPEAELSFSGTGITVISYVDRRIDQIVANLKLDPQAALGLRDVRVTQPDGRSATLAGAFEVASPVEVTFLPLTMTGRDAAGQPVATELTLTNRGSAPVPLTILYTAASGGGGAAIADSLPRGQRRIPDVLAYLRTRGVALEESATGAAGTLHIAFHGAVLPRQVSLSARTLTDTPFGKVGYSYHGNQTGAVHLRSRGHCYAQPQLEL